MDGITQNISTLQDSRRSVFFSHFLNPNSKHFKNIYSSAIAAKFSKQEANLIQHEPWFLHGVGPKRREEIFTNNENFLLELSQLNTLTEEGKQDPQLLKIKLTAALAGLEGLGKDYYSKRTEENKTNVNVNIFKVLDQIQSGSYSAPKQDEQPIPITNYTVIPNKDE